MSQHYSDPTREHDEHALPDVEVFPARYANCEECGELLISPDLRTTQCACHACNGRVTSCYADAAFFYWFCFPGCLPDSEAIGPFASRAEALADARDQTS